MRFKLDENLPSSAADYLSKYGHDALTVVQQGMAGDSDPQVAEVCREEERILLTLDVGFADIRSYPPKEHAGIIVLRLSRQDKPSVMEVLRKLTQALQIEPVTGKLWIVDEERVRIRG